MRTYTVTRREGEHLGPINWDYNFLSHFDGYCGADKQKYCDEHVEKLRKLVNGGGWQATTDGGWPRVGWGRVVAVGMWDGWPYWRPVPSVAILGTFGVEWHSFSSITSIEPAPKYDPPTQSPSFDAGQPSHPEGSECATPVAEKGTL